MLYFLDTESAGLKGHLLSVQLAREFNEPGAVIIHRHLEYREILNLLNQPTNVFVGWNVGFDIWKLYQFFKPNRPFQARFLDLQDHIMARPPLCYLNLGRSKTVVKRIPQHWVGAVEEKITQEIKKTVPSGVEVKVKHSRQGEFVSLTFSLSMSGKLKDVVRATFKGEVVRADEALYLPEHLEFKEDLRNMGRIASKQKILYDMLYDLNIDLMHEPSDRGERAWKYALDDVRYLQRLWAHYKMQESDINDDDHCTHCVAYTKYVGLRTDVPKVKVQIKKLKERKLAIDKALNINVQSSAQRAKLLAEHCPVPITSTARPKLKILLDSGLLDERGQYLTSLILDYKPVCQRLEQLKMLLKSPISPDFKVRGTATGRMACRGGFNFQGVSRDKELRELFLLSQGGDFDNLEIKIAAKVFGDTQLAQDIEQGIDLHTMTCSLVFSDRLNNLVYSDLMEVKGDKRHSLHEVFKGLRNRAKQLNFAVLYFCTSTKIAKLLQVDEQRANEIMQSTFFARYPQMLATRKRFEEMFCTADLDTWSKTSVADMATCVRDIFNTPRYVHFERLLASLFWERADEIASVARDDKSLLVRTESKGRQTPYQAIRSACLGAAIGIQRSVSRQLGNYPIQATGARLTKMLMARIFLQHGVPILNVHDELIVPSGFESKLDAVKETVQRWLRQMQCHVPHLSMSWDSMSTWADK